MSQINLGSIKFKWQGAYNGATAYTVDDVVSYNGSSYICILASTGNLPTNATYFEQMSSAGTNGTDGTDLTSTLTTQGDMLYRDGSGLQRLAKGTAGQALLMNSGATAPEWGTASGGGSSTAFAVYRGDQAGTGANIYQKFTGATVIVDTDSAYDSSNYEYVIPSDGTYLLGATFRFYGTSSNGDFHDVAIKFDWDTPTGYTTKGGTYNQDNYSGGANITAGTNYFWFTSILPNNFITGQRVWVEWKYDNSGYYGLWSNSPGTTNRFWITKLA